MSFEQIVLIFNATTDVMFYHENCDTFFLSVLSLVIHALIQLLGILIHDSL